MRNAKEGHREESPQGATWRPSVYTLDCFAALAMTLLCLLPLNGCKGCSEPESIQVSGESLKLHAEKMKSVSETSAQPAGPHVIEIKALSHPASIDKTEGSPSTSTSVASASPPPLASSPNQPKITETPPGAVEEESLSKRLADRLKESKIPYDEKNPPKIYVSNQTINEFSNYYESRGNKVSRMSIPASTLVAPLLQDHPELAAKIDIKALENTVINQVVVEGTGVSAADKYIDPDTLQVVDKLFVTDMPADLGAKPSPRP